MKAAHKAVNRLTAGALRELSWSGQASERSDSKAQLCPWPFPSEHPQTKLFACRCFDTCQSCIEDGVERGRQSPLSDKHSFCQL